ncbi:hypothetical protein A7X84_11220 [Stenotrophomonas maltophilia]|uniref:hypothetical protein n=1 Tax=Stenotrophomonas maltophilia TaxID=40324 RepID=UPI00038F78EC|nr:hypothetical protein [Stenotrophomonas maltophilia]EQM83606.1 hypothetical protein L681_07390 [Stenotrophomonas maltophilia MF89]PZS82095.1 hypothetical protein A7X84_11220 [Stenotrophomonas maltophilia]PZT18170.1 hypothetical protein A7X82_05455 [Stenotrophomonas maltophilia]
MNRFLKAAGLTAVYVVVLLAVYVIHMRYFAVDVVFYAAIGDAFIALVITGLLLLLPCFRALSGLEKSLLCIIWLLGGYSFAISVPTVIDRSLSFYILEKLEQRGGGIRQSAFQDVFTKEYMVEHRLVDVRLTEQESSGTVEIVNGCVRLTKKGERIAALSRFYRKNLLPKRRLLLGVYSDDLTDPFRHSLQNVDYRCR